MAVLAAAAAACAASPERGQAPAGERVFVQCVSCHALEPGANTPAGPTLHAIVGKPVAAEPGFDYSPALQSFARKHRRWTPELLDRMTADPEALVPGTYMGFHGIVDPQERAALVGYLEQVTVPRR